MNMRRELRSDRRLWLAFGALAFVLLGFLHMREFPNFWRGAAMAVSSGEWQMALLFIVPAAPSLAIPATVIGWACQAIVVAIREMRLDMKGEPPGLSRRDEPAGSPGAEEKM